MATVDEDLDQLEKEIRQVKIEYEQYFGGGRKRPPQDTVWRIELLIKKYSEMGGRINFAQRFRFNNLSQTFAKYQDMWRKKFKAKEEGVVQRHFGAAARAIEAERAKEHAAELAVTQAAEEKTTKPAAKRAAAAASEGTSVMALTDPEREAEKVQQFYEQLMEAKQKAGEKSGTMSFDSFKQFVQQKTAQLKQKGAREVEYAFSVEGGQVKLKARVKS